MRTELAAPLAAVLCTGLLVIGALGVASDITTAGRQRASCGTSSPVAPTPAAPEPRPAPHNGLPAFNEAGR
jgi:hypothetical protein